MSDLTGQIGIVTQAKRWSMGWWVEKVTRSPAHHVVIAINDEVCISAEPGGVCYRLIAEYGDRIHFTQYDLTHAEQSNIVWFADGHIGIDYNIRAFIALGVEYLTRIPVPAWLVAHLNGRSRVTCSQLATDILRSTNIQPIPTARLVTPKHWHDLATTQGWIHTT